MVISLLFIFRAVLLGSLGATAPLRCLALPLAQTRRICRLFVNCECPELTNDINNLVLKLMMLNWKHKQNVCV